MTTDGVEAEAGDEDGDEDEPTGVEVEVEAGGAVVDADTPETVMEEDEGDPDPLCDVLLVEFALVVRGAGVTVIVVPKVPVPRGSAGLLMVKN